MADYIKREDAIAEINKRSQYICDNDFGVIIRTENVINEIHAADVRPVGRAKWIINSDGATVCENCGNEATLLKLTHTEQTWTWTGPPVLSRYCPNCGAMMEDADD